MASKRCVLLLVLSGILIFGVGCRTLQPKPAKLLKIISADKENPKIEAAETIAVAPEAQKAEQPKTETPKVEPVKAEPPKAAANTVAVAPEAQKAEQPKTETPKVEPVKTEPPKAEAAKTIAAVPEAQKAEQPKTETQKAEPATLPPKTEAAKAKPIVLFYEQCGTILNPTFVNDKGLVDYKTLKRKRQHLQEVLNAFAAINPNEYDLWPKEDKIAFWLNVYNIELLKIIVDNYPIQASRIRLVFWPPTSIRHITGIWTDYKFIVMGEQFTLSEIERRFFRKEFGEPRVFMGISQASFSSPPLRNEPYRGNKVYEQLDEQARKFLSSPSALKVDAENQAVNLSAIFQSSWYGNEFINKYGTDKKFKDQPAEARAVLNFIINYVPKETASYLEVKNYSVKYITYDWRLNE